MEQKRKTWGQFWRFLAFSLGAGVIEFLSFTLITCISSADEVVFCAEVVSVALSCLFNFTLNRKYTFGETSALWLRMLGYGLFYLVTTPLWAMFILWLKNAFMAEELAKLIKMVLNFALDFSFCKFVLFRIGVPKKEKCGEEGKQA